MLRRVLGFQAIGLLSLLIYPVGGLSADVNTNRSWGNNALSEKRQDPGDMNTFRQAGNLSAFRPTMYLKMTLGFGVGTKDISLYMSSVQGSNPLQEVTIWNGGGLDVAGLFGYHFKRNLMVEGGMGYQTVAEDPSVEDADCSFNRIPLFVNLLWILNPEKSFHFYLGGGPVYIASAKLTRDVNSSIGNVKNVVTYSPATGFQGIFGVKSRPGGMRRFFFFGEVKYYAGLKYKWDEHTENGIAVEPFPDWQKFNGDQVIFLFGIAYYL